MMALLQARQIDEGMVRLTTHRGRSFHRTDRRRAPAFVPPLPEQGQIVNVRGATWAVADVRAQGLPRSPADEGEPGLTHVVELQSLEEDRLGQELAVVWELEVGHTVAPTRACRRRSARMASTSRTRSPPSWTPSAGARSPRRTATPSRRRSAAERTSRPTSSSRCGARCSPRGRTCCSPTTWAWARPSRPAWSCRSCCCGTAPGR